MTRDAVYEMKSMVHYCGGGSELGRDENDVGSSHRAVSLDRLGSAWREIPPAPPGIGRMRRPSLFEGVSFIGPRLVFMRFRPPRSSPQSRRTKFQVSDIAASEIFAGGGVASSLKEDSSNPTVPLCAISRARCLPGTHSNSFENISLNFGLLYMRHQAIHGRITEQKRKTSVGSGSRRRSCW